MSDGIRDSAPDREYKPIEWTEKEKRQYDEDLVRYYLSNGVIAAALKAESIVNSTKEASAIFYQTNMERARQNLYLRLLAARDAENLLETLLANIRSGSDSSVEVLARFEDEISSVLALLKKRPA